MKVSNGREAFTVLKHWLILHNIICFKYGEIVAKKRVLAYARIPRSCWSQDLSWKRENELNNVAHDYIQFVWLWNAVYRITGLIWIVLHLTLQWHVELSSSWNPFCSDISLDTVFSVVLSKEEHGLQWRGRTVWKEHWQFSILYI